MRHLIELSGVQRLEEYFRRIGDVLGEDSRRGSFAIYAMGLLGDGERKSVEPIAARACPDPSKTDAMHQRLLHFTVNSCWSDPEPSPHIGPKTSWKTGCSRNKPANRSIKGISCSSGIMGMAW